MSDYFAARNSKPSKAGAYKIRSMREKSSNDISSLLIHVAFRKLYDRGDFPIAVNYDSRGKKIKWKGDIDSLDYHYYLPLFFTGLVETDDPYAFLVEQAISDMLVRGSDKVPEVVPQLILPLKAALSTKDPKVVTRVLKILQKLVSAGPAVGEALVPYYRQLLPVFNLYKNRNVNIGDGIYYAQRKGECLGDLIEETLQKFEASGGQEAFVNIKYMVPTYQSCIVKGQ